MGKAVDIPRATREAVHERDQGLCRLCGRWADPPALHHIVFRSQDRNNHDPSNLVTLGQAYGHICHQITHAHARLVTPALEAVVALPGTTGLQWLRREGHDIRGLLRGSL